MIVTIGGRLSNLFGAVQTMKSDELENFDEFDQQQPVTLQLLEFYSNCRYMYLGLLRCVGSDKSNT